METGLKSLQTIESAINSNEDTQLIKELAIELNEVRSELISGSPDYKVIEDALGLIGSVVMSRKTIEVISQERANIIRK